MSGASSMAELSVPTDDGGSIPTAPLHIVPIELKQLNLLVAKLHRHHKPVQGHRFSIGVEYGGILVGGCSVGRPTARLTDQRKTLEVTRLVTDGTKNACSMLYAAAARAGKALGYEKIQTFILESELGTTLRAAGWKFDGESGGGDWNRESTRLRKSWLFDDYNRTDQPQGVKHRYSKILNGLLATPMPLMGTGAPEMTNPARVAAERGSVANKEMAPVGLRRRRGQLVLETLARVPWGETKHKP